jgi:hypothetical protein
MVHRAGHRTRAIQRAEQRRQGLRSPTPSAQGLRCLQPAGLDLPSHHRAHQSFLAGARRIRIRNKRADKFLSSRFVHWATRLQEWFRTHAVKEDFRLWTGRP